MRFLFVAKIVLFAAVLAAVTGSAAAGPIAYGICQSGCNAIAVACYASAGLTFGAVTAGRCFGAPAAAVACNLALGKCMACCIAAGFAPTF
ncbi:hypothetical protein VOLCADRAFT_59734 [Volvox carteri f. nagariensis]|uniref:Uncharacterized protein lzy1b-1 n=1 Tax=Volvox carteri f. nagariensis TaxID=3068 RepID=D8TTS0_VOLCA|nr:uncharacterized protein VOLCADRAFT_59734 [Volvox carteri f. nagariensis]EFJ49359.1 hypothetical protein VOLCADRAFT_59734 [Volvox carteri f. nagariensis]|eukprot:XP_002949807.1 hypothetical protein VOLCADRAFT_59734 [Volvox carteri f. nagariensis]